jgi:hypothetical protein
MRKQFKGAVVGLLATLFLSSLAVAQTPPPTHGTDPWMYYPEDVPEGTGGPAPKRDITGTWNGPGSSDAIPRPSRAEVPPLTPLGQKLMSENKPIAKYGPAGSNDPNVRYCDPLGFPLNMIYQNRAMSIAVIPPNRVVILNQFGNYWREIWTDGRPLPTTVNGTGPDALDPAYNGYSTGHWEDDYNFVVKTNGLDDRTWLLRDGTPHSMDAVVTERYTRVDHNTLRVSISIEDPKIFTKPSFTLGTFVYKWVPNQRINEWECLPSEQLRYLEQQGDPAGSYPNAPEQHLGNGGGR